MRSREAALRQSSRKQNSGYWRQISRPTSSRSRCFSFSPIVRTQGTISAGVTEAALQTEAEIETIPTNLPHLRLPAPRADSAAHRRTVRRLLSPKAPPKVPAARARPRARRTTVVRARGRHPAPEPSRSAAPPSRAGAARRPPTEEPAVPVISRPLFGNPGKAVAPSNRLYCGGEKGLCRNTGEITAPAAARPCLRDTPSSQGPLGTVVFECEPAGGWSAWSCPLPLSKPSFSPCRPSAEIGDRSKFCRKPNGEQGGTPLSPSFARATGIHRWITE